MNTKDNVMKLGGD